MAYCGRGLLKPFVPYHARIFEIVDLQPGAHRWGFRRRPPGPPSVAAGVSAGVSAPLAATAQPPPHSSAAVDVSAAPGWGTALLAHFQQDAGEGSWAGRPDMARQRREPAAAPEWSEHAGSRAAPRWGEQEHNPQEAGRSEVRSYRAHEGATWRDWRGRDQSWWDWRDRWWSESQSWSWDVPGGMDRWPRNRLQ